MKPLLKYLRIRQAQQRRSVPERVLPKCVGYMTDAIRAITGIPVMIIVCCNSLHRLGENVNLWKDRWEYVTHYNLLGSDNINRQLDSFIQRICLRQLLPTEKELRQTLIKLRKVIRIIY